MPYKGHQEKKIMELGLELLKSRRCFRCLCCLFKIMRNQVAEYLNNLIPKRKQNFNSRNIYIPSYNCWTEYFKSFFPCLFWGMVPPWSEYKKFIYAFKQKLLPFICLLENSISNIFDPEGLKLLTRLHLSFSHVSGHCFQHNFQECLNPLCTCSIETENISHYLLHCHHNALFHTDLMNSVKTFVVESLSDSKKVEIILYGDSQCNDNKDNSILSASL